MTARIEDLTGPTQLEAMSPSLTMEWDPIANTGTILFQVGKYLVVDGEIRADVPPAAAPSVIRELATIQTMQYGTGLVDPVTGASLDGITPMGIMVYAKAAFDALYTEDQTPPEHPPIDPEAGTGDPEEMGL